MFIVTGYDERTDGFMALKGDGSIYTKKELQVIINRFVRFYNNTDDKYINEYNIKNKIKIEKELNAPIIKEPQNKKGVVYFLKADNGLTKIGETKDIKNRIKAINHGLLNETKLLFYIASEDVCTLEEKLHKRFSKKRVKGEWFDLSDNDIFDIKSKMISSIKGDDLIE